MLTIPCAGCADRTQAHVLRLGFGDPDTSDRLAWMTDDITDDQVADRMIRGARLASDEDRRKAGAVARVEIDRGDRVIVIYRPYEDPEPIWQVARLPKDVTWAEWQPAFEDYLAASAILKAAR
jgi:hypothetical protein